MASLEFILKRRGLTIEKWVSVKSIKDRCCLETAIKRLGADQLSELEINAILSKQQQHQPVQPVQAVETVVSQTGEFKQVKKAVKRKKQIEQSVLLSEPCDNTMSDVLNDSGED